MALLDVDQWSVLNWMRYAAVCSRCGATDSSVTLCTAMTAYHVASLNAPLLLCYQCAEDYYDYWTAQWEEYNRSRG